MKPHAFTLTELIVSLCVVLVLSEFTLLAAARLDGRRERIKCASNLRQIGQALLLYSNDNRGPYPRTKYDMDKADHPTFFTGIDNKDPFAKECPQVNDVSAALFLLLRTEDITSQVFLCPSSDALADKFGGGRHTALDQSNFSSPDNLSYSYADPYPARGAAGKGYKLVQGLDPNFAVAADINPGGDSLTKLTVNSTAADLRSGNSPNHHGDGQNVLFGDGHVEFQNNPFCDAHRDNIYTYGDSGLDPITNAPRPTGGAGIIGSPIGPDDSVLLPTAAEKEDQGQGPSN